MRTTSPTQGLWPTRPLSQRAGPLSHQLLVGSVSMHMAGGAEPPVLRHTLAHARTFTEGSWSTILPISRKMSAIGTLMIACSTIAGVGKHPQAAERDDKRAKWGRRCEGWQGGPVAGSYTQKASHPIPTPTTHTSTPNHQHKQTITTSHHPTGPTANPPWQGTPACEQSRATGRWA